MESGLIYAELNFHGSPAFTLCTSVPWKRGGRFRLMLKSMQMILSLFQRELIDWRNPLPGLKGPMVLAASTWENPQPFFGPSLCLSPWERNSMAG